MKSTEQNTEGMLQISALRLKCDPAALEKGLLGAEIFVTGYFYAVDLGPCIHPRHHRVGKNDSCTCYLGKLCPAVDMVRAYLSAGGEPAPDPPPGYYPVIPSNCPICHARVYFDARLSSRERGAGWRCEAAGSAHYWQCMVRVLAWKFACKHANIQGLPPPDQPPSGFW